MKKIGIITINDYNNYGNRLQSYALQKVLSEMKMLPENIITCQDNKEHKEKMTIERFIKQAVKKIISIIEMEKIYKSIRMQNFKKFNEKYITESVKNMNFYSIKSNYYDYIIVGSDQVWNYNFSFEPISSFALFSPKEKNISYAASFGVDNIDEKWRTKYIEGLNNFKKISVREHKGLQLVKELINEEAVLVLDPTLLVKKQDWEKLEIKAIKNNKQKYILTYFLGRISLKRNKELKKIAKKYNMKIVNLGKIQYGKYYTAGPSEFLWYIHNAEIVFTDSFHACVFSIIFDKNFYVMDREDNMKPMNSRIDTLLEIFNLKNRKFINWNSISLEHKYSYIDKILEEERKKSLNFLKKALDIEE